MREAALCNGTSSPTQIHGDIIGMIRSDFENKPISAALLIF